MKRAKLLLLCLAAIIISFALPDGKTYASAETSASAYSYAQATERDVYFYKDKDTRTALFAIPYTYCVHILSTDEEWCYVKYAEDNGLYRALYGYCLKECLTPVDVPPENIYLDKPVTVTYKTDTPPVASLPVLGELNVTAAYYGTYYVGGEAYSYVLYENSFGYISGANDEYPLNEIPAPPEPPAKRKGGTNAKLITALALTALAAAALIILYFTGRRRRFRAEG